MIRFLPKYAGIRARSSLCAATITLSLLAGGIDCAKKQSTAAEADAAKAKSASEANDGFDPSTVPGRIHLVQPNETLWSLSEMYYGNSRQWRRILVANRRRVTDPTNLTVGMKLIIP